MEERLGGAAWRTGWPRGGRPWTAGGLTNDLNLLYRSRADAENGCPLGGNPF